MPCRAKDTMREGQHRGWDGSVSTRTRGCAVLAGTGDGVDCQTRGVTRDEPYA